MAEAIENKLLVDVLRMTLNADECVAADPPIVFLESLAEELKAEGAQGRLNLHHGVMDRALMTRLTDAPVENYTLPPFHYLLSCFTRASDKLRSTHSGASSATDADHFRKVLTDALQQLANFIWLCVAVEGVIWQPPESEKRGVLQFYDSLWATQQSTPAWPGATVNAVPLPLGLLDMLSSTNGDDMNLVLEPALRQLCEKTHSTSVLGDYFSLINIWTFLISSRPTSIVLANSPSFIPADALSGNLAPNGRIFLKSPLAALFGISYLPDDGALLEAQPSVRAQVFNSVDMNSPSPSFQHDITSLQQASKAVVTGLCNIVSPKGLLAKDTRPQMVKWLGAALNSNQERAKMQVNYLKASGDGFAVNLCRVMLHLCEPFMDFINGKAIQFINLNYLAGSGELQYNDETRLVASNAEFEQWRQQRVAAEAAKPHFISECFFMTARAMHLSLGKIAEALESNDARALQQLQGMLQRGDRSPQQLQIQNQVVMTMKLMDAEVDLAADWTMRMQRKHVGDNVQYDRVKARYLARTTLFSDPDLVTSILRWCKLVASWLLYTATGCANPAQVQLPLPESPPLDFQMIPEYLIGDMCDVIKHVTVHASHLVGQSTLEEVALCCTAFMSSPAYIRNPYMRYRLAEVLYYWMPDQGGPSARWRRGQSTSMEFLFTSHPAVVSQIVPGLLVLYQDIEYTERGNQFFEKFSMRQQIAELLEWLWEVPQHREAWKALAAHQGERYMRFLNYLVNDCIYLLDEALKKLPEVKAAEAIRDDPSRWAALGLQGQAQHTADLQQMGSMLRFYLSTAGKFIKMLVYTSAEIAAPLLLPEMVERLANMLNYFLKHLTGSERGKLKVKKPEQYSFNPKELLANILTIYLHVWSADKEGVFVTAIAEDGRSYKPENFTEAISVASKVGLPGISGNHVAGLEQMAERVAEAAEQQKMDDETFLDIPDEFTDPIMCTLMKDPVILPTSNTTMDRAAILRHLLSDPRDPINRAPLTKEQLVPDTQLKARIDEWLAQQRAQRNQS